MSSDPTFISSSNQERWILEIDNYISKEHTMNIDSEYPTCVFRVPKSLSESKPEAYTPQRIGLGPYHHLRPEFYATQKHKISTIKRFLGSQKLQVFIQVVTALVNSESVVRACYDQYLDFHIETLARVLAIDILYLLQLFKTRKASDMFPKEVVWDIMMLENQIPVVLLKKIGGVLTSHKICELGHGKHALSAEFEDFCRAHSPLEMEEFMSFTELHLLHYMYRMVVDNTGGFSQAAISQSADQVAEFSEDVSTCLEILGTPVVPLRQIRAIWERVKRIVTRIKKNENLPVEHQIVIPSVSEMTDTVGIQFNCSLQGIRSIEYEVDSKVFLLPSIRPDANSEIILRALVAFEAASGSSRALASYVDLMCAIIKVNKDVDILKAAKIIIGELSDEEIVGIFNEMRSSTGDNYKRPLHIEQVIEKVNKIYEDVCNVKVKRFVNKYFNVSWKILSLGVAIVVVVLLTLQTLCSLVGCSRWFGKSTTVQTGFGFLYADH